MSVQSIESDWSMLYRNIRGHNLAYLEVNPGAALSIK